MSERRLWLYFDWPLLIVVLLLCALSVAMIYSATITTVDLFDYWLRQLVFIGIGLFVFFLAALFDYRNLELFGPLAFLVLMGLLVAVLAFGTIQGGSKRWLDVGGTLVQPTEAGKFLLIIYLAWFLNRFQDRMGRLPYLMIAILLLLAPIALVYLQPNLGMTLLYVFLGGTLILVGGIPFWQVLLMAVAGLAMTPFLWSTLQGYMVERITVFLNPASNPEAAFNINQALIAVGSGGWLGQGWGYGSQNQLHFLRVRHTDFIFSVIAEELGLLGALAVIALLFFVVWRCLRVADLAQDQFGRLLAVGVAALLFFQTVVNVGMNLSLMPVTGLTLPFISYGGSSLISVFFAVGLAQSVIMRHRKIEYR